MSDNGWSRLLEERSAGKRDTGAVSLAWQCERISQADCFRDLAFAIAGMLTVAAIANLLVLSL